MPGIQRLLLIYLLGVFWGVQALFGQARPQRDDEKLCQEGLVMMNRGLDALSARDYERAKISLLTCLEKGHLYGTQFSPLKVSFVMMYIKRLILERPDCKSAFEAHLHGLLDLVQRGDFQIERIDHLTELAEILGLEKPVSRLHASVMARIKEEKAKSAWVREIFPILFKEKQFTEIVRYMDLAAEGRRTWSRVKKRLLPESESRNVMVGVANSFGLDLKLYVQIYRRIGYFQKLAEVELLQSDLRQTLDSLK